MLEFDVRVLILLTVTFNTDEEERPSTHDWCLGVPLLQLLHQAEHAFPQSYCQDLVCSPVNNHSYPAHFCLGAAADPQSQGECFISSFTLMCDLNLHPDV